MQRSILLFFTLCVVASAQQLPEGYISLARPIPTGGAPTIQTKCVRPESPCGEYVIIFHKGDEVLSGLTDFVIANKIRDAHFTGIGAVSGALVAWLDLSKKAYKALPVREQVEVLSLIGDVAEFNAKPIVHMHAVLGRSDGTTTGGHVWELHANPTLEVFMTVNSVPLHKKPDEASGMKFIDPTQ